MASGAGGSLRSDPGDDKRAVDRRIDSLEDDLQDTSADLVRAWQRVRRTTAQLNVARAELAAAQREVQTRRQRAEELKRRLDVARASEQQALDDLAQTERSTQAADERVGAIARQARQTGGVGELSVALAAQSADDFAARMAAVDTALQLQGQAITELDVRRAETKARQAKLTAIREQIALLEKEARDNLARAQAAERAARAAQVRVASLLASQRQAAAAIQARRAAERRRLGALEAERGRLEARLRAIAARELRAASADDGGGSGGADSPGGYLSSPTPGAPVTSEFGMRYHPILHYTRLHAGMDFGAPCGTPVRAAATGRVIQAGWAGGYGNRITVAHGNVRGHSLATTYSHLSRIVQGGGVTRGQIIGYVGTTGTSTGCHLHFETYQGGTPVNPRGWL
ncbi:MAG: peptidoglycan DD-metalloendopeptidase family protein [Angustibacter sp.]